MATYRQAVQRYIEYFEAVHDELYADRRAALKRGDVHLEATLDEACMMVSDIQDMLIQSVEDHDAQAEALSDNMAYDQFRDMMLEAM